MLNAYARFSGTCLGAIVMTSLLVGCEDRLADYPAMPSCTFEFSPTSRTHGPQGDTGAVTVTASSRRCDWTVGVDVSWVTLANGNGTGNGTVNYSVATNQGESRTGTLTLAERSFTITQTSGCMYVVSPTSVNVGLDGGNAIINVNTSGECTWTATSQAEWLTIARGATGSGAGTVTFSVSGNTGSQRSATLTVGGQRVTVTQAACTYSVSPLSNTSDRIPKSGGSRNISVTTHSTCTWTAASEADWLTITRGATGTGNGTVTVSASANQDTAGRLANVRVAGRTVIIYQN